MLRTVPSRHGQSSAASPGRQPSSVASTESATLPFRAWLIGQPSLAASASWPNVAASSPGTFAADGERGRDDAPAGLQLLEADRRLDLQRRGRRPVAPEPARERHRVARGMGRGDELLGAGAAVGSLGPRCPRHREAGERAAGDVVDRALALDERAVPGHFGGTNGGHGSLLHGVVRVGCRAGRLSCGSAFVRVGCRAGRPPARPSAVRGAAAPTRLRVLMVRGVGVARSADAPRQHQPARATAPARAREARSRGNVARVAPWKAR